MARIHLQLFGIMLYFSKSHFFEIFVSSLFVTLHSLEISLSGMAAYGRDPLIIQISLNISIGPELGPESLQGAPTTWKTQMLYF
jgi:hypothetical protein